MKNILNPKVTVLAVAIFTSVSMNASANNIAPMIKEQPHNIYHIVKNKTLLAVTNQIANRAGIAFKINAGLEYDLINQKIAADDWKAALAQFLYSYNYTTILDHGTIKTVVITGRNGSGQDNEVTAASESGLVVVVPDSAKKLPEKYQNYIPGSVMSVNLPMKELAGIPVGEDLTLDLPIGQYKVKHDNLVDHGDGSSTWIGYLDEEGKGYRVYLSQGDAGVIGNVYTPDGAYNIETVDGATVIVDLEKSGLQNSGFENDEAKPIVNALMDAGVNMTADAEWAKTNANIAEAGYAKKLRKKSPVISAGAALTSSNVVDLMVLYTTQKQTAVYAKQRINYLVAVSNQAYKDSGIDMSLRLVHARPTSYVDNNSNSQALSDLASSRGAFTGTAALRNQYGADLVMLFRPLYAQTAGSCGTAYVGFANGGNGNANYGYGTIGDGSSKDALSNYYCGTNTFTHEIGHSLGNVHDREYSSFTGKFSYSYAWGVKNKFGTIMSYNGPSIMLFSTPNLPTQCAGTACGFVEGNANSSDQVRTINYTAPIVRNYKPTTVSVPVIQ
jgi:Metallo-peptidase family M12B Reprolysin-like